MAEPPRESNLSGGLRDSLLGALEPALAEPRAAAGDVEAEQPLSSARFAGEDFLYHLYRGSELLQDNCVEEAKEELERAIRMQPLDVEGQGLLGVVYFRLGLYPRAIEIYREITRACPDEITPKLNLSLCYLKTGQPSEAKDLLEDILRRSPEHKRAWGYLGLSFERMGEYSRAQGAFERAGQPHLARRMQQLLDDLSAQPAVAHTPREEVRRAAAEAVAELDGPDAEPFVRAELDPANVSLRAGRWRAHEPGEDPIPSAQPLPRVTAPVHAAPTTPVGASAENAALLNLQLPSVLQGLHSARGAASVAPLSIPELLIQHGLQLPNAGAARTREGLVLLVLQDQAAVRSDRLRATTHEGDPLRVGPLMRRARGKDTEEHFGSGSWISVSGRGLLVLESTSDNELLLLKLAGEFVYLRERRLVAFESSLRYENGRLPASDPGPVPMVQMSGEGHVVCEVSSGFGTLAVSAGRQATVRAASVLGWTGRLLGQALSAERALQLGSGFVTFSGEGAVLVDDP